jgi:hypothetical protein
MAANYVLLETVQLSQSASSITLDNIPQTGYTDLKIVTSFRTDASGANWALIGVNGGADTVSTLTHLLAFGGSIYAQSYSSFRTTIAYSSLTTYAWSSSEINITNYTSNSHKAISGTGVLGSNSSSAYSLQLANYTYPSTSAISSLAFTVDGGGNFVAGSTVSLYGLAATGTSPAIAPKAQGGNIVANDGTYWYHAFLSSGTFTPKLTLTCDVLTVAGGGGGSAGGGGAGGLVYSTSNSVSATNYTVTVGAGGNRGVSDINGSQGSNSQFGALTAAIGGGFGAGGAVGAVTGGNGGSGGGAGAAQGATTVTASGGTGSQGYNGGSISSTSRGGAGGGGAGQVGSNGSTNTGGVGGNGINTYSSWHTATSTGVSGYIAGGGGGTSTSTTTKAGGSGGGGNGGGDSGTSATSGITNTGSGGGGDRANSAGLGGSGIVIIRYAMA